jgi:hypothetical protein
MAKLEKQNLTKKEAKAAMAAKRQAKEEKAIREGRILRSEPKPEPVKQKVSSTRTGTTFKTMKKETPRAVPFDPKTVDDKKYILCLKHGDKYDFEYVNRLYNMCKRHTTFDFEMVCLTDDDTNIHKDIKIIELPKGVSGWWCKPYMFSNDLGLNGTILYMDLDVVIGNNIDRLFDYMPERWCIIRDFSRKMRPGWKRYNSSIIRFYTGQLNHVWEEFKQQPRQIMSRFWGDQDYLWDVDKTACLWPDRWILSWKWEVRESTRFQPGGTRGKRRLDVVEDCVPPIDCMIAVFHGDPNPYYCDDPWVKKNWT